MVMDSVNQENAEQGSNNGSTLTAGGRQGPARVTSIRSNHYESYEPTEAEREWLEYKKKFSTRKNVFRVCILVLLIVLVASSWFLAWIRTKIGKMTQLSVFHSKYFRSFRSLLG